MKRALTILVLLATLVAIFAVPASARSQGRSYLIIAVGDQLPEGLAGEISAAGGTLVRTIPQIGLAVATFGSADDAQTAADIPGIEAVVPNLKLQWVDPGHQVALEFGNPPSSGDDDFYFDLQYGHDAVDAPEAWEVGARGAGARVAVLDTGFDLDHVDLAPNINYGLSTSFVPGEGLEYALDDPFSHGSHVAGTIAAADNGFGTIGVAPEAELMLVKVLGDEGSGEFDWVIAGIVYAADNDADVINMSLGAVLPRRGTCDESGCADAIEVAQIRSALARATNYAYNKGTTIIASAGNESIDFDEQSDLIHLPSMSPRVLSVSATTPIGWAIDPSTDLDVITSYTNYGMGAVEFAAPGGDILYPGSEICTVGPITHYCFVFDLVFSTGSNLDPMTATYYWGGGTSQAAPHVSGVAAIIIGEHGGSMHPWLVKRALRRSADDLGAPGKDPFYGYGRVNAYNAVD